MTPTHPALAGLGHGRCLVIGEVAQTHDGSLGLAHAFIDAIAAAGADAVKFQTHIAAAESTPAEPLRVTFSRQDASRYDYWRRMEFTEEQWQGLADHCRERGVLFLSLAVLARGGGAARAHRPADLEDRVGRGLATRRCSTACSTRGGPVLLSTGMSALAETDAAVARVTARGRRRRRAAVHDGLSRARPRRSAST